MVTEPPTWFQLGLVLTTRPSRVAISRIARQTSTVTGIRESGVSTRIERRIGFGAGGQYRKLSRSRGSDHDTAG
jgi:hypothetical protein